MPLRRRSFRTLLITHILMFVLPTLVIASIVNYMFALLSERQEASRQASLDQFALSIDAQLYDMLRFSQTLTDNKSVSFLTNRSSLSERMDYYTYYNVRLTMDYISRVMSTNNGVKNVYIYFSSSSRVLQSDGVYSDAFYYRQYLSGIFTSEQEWITFLHSSGTGSFLSDNAGNIFYISCLNSKLPTYIVMQLDENLLSGMSSSLSQQGIVGFFNPKGDLLFSTGNGELAKIQLSGVSGSKMVVDGKPYVLYSKESVEKTSCIFALLVPYESGNEPIRALMTWAVLIGCMTLALEFALAVLLSQKNYDPIRQLREVISPSEAKSAGDDIAAIKTYMTTLYEDRISLEQQSIALGKALRDSMLKHLLSEDDSGIESVGADLASLGMTIEAEWVCVVTARLPKDSTAANAALINFSVMNVFEELLKLQFQVFSLEINRDVVFVLCTRDADIGISREVLQSQLMKGYEFIGAHFGLKLMICSSDLYQGLGELRRAWNKVLAIADRQDAADPIQLEWLQDQGQGSQLQSNMMENLLTLRQKLTNMMMNGNKEGVASEFALLQQNNLPGWYVRIIVVEALLGSINALNQNRAAPDEAQRESLVDELDNLTRLPQHRFWQSAGDIAGRICEYMSNRSLRAKTENLDWRVNEILEREYGNQALNVALISYRLGITASYLTAIYKEKTGQSILSALNQRRIAASKNLLVQSRKSIEEIALMTGFYNSAALIRVFKRYEGITPGQYRTLYRD